MGNPFGTIIKTAAKVAAKAKSPTAPRAVNTLLKGKESMVNANNPYKMLKKPRTMTKAEMQQKLLDDSYRKKGGAIKTKKK